VREITDFPQAIESVIGPGAQTATERTLAARSLVEEVYDWDAIARRIKPRILDAALRTLQGEPSAP